MTREEAIKTLKENYCAMCAYGSQDMDSCDIRSCDNKDAIETLEQTRWIPGSERFPEIGQYVLCSLIKAKDVKHRVIICEYKQEVWWSYVQAWMPLPQPYKGESDE